MTESLALVLLFGAPLVFQGPTNDTGDLEKLQGGWVQVSTTFQGRPAPADQLSLKAMLKGDQWTVIPVAEAAKALGTVTFKLDGRIVPKSIDVIGGSGVARHGIYKLEGDTLTICSETGSGERPREFKATSTTSLQVWKRSAK